MAFVNDGDASALRKLFAGMDAGDEDVAVRAMNEAAVFLRQHDLCFRQIVRRIEACELLLPSKVGAAIQLMDSTTLSEAESALAGARRLMKNCGLTFVRFVDALAREPADAGKLEELKCAYQIEIERSREMEAELEILRARFDGTGSFPTGSPFRNFVLVMTLLFGVLLVASITSTVMDLFEPANATAKPRRPALVQRAAVDPAPSPTPAPAPRATGICWRDRSIHGPCF